METVALLYIYLRKQWGIDLIWLREFMEQKKEK